MNINKMAILWCAANHGLLLREARVFHSVPAGTLLTFTIQKFGSDKSSCVPAGTLRLSQGLSPSTRSSGGLHFQEHPDIRNPSGCKANLCSYRSTSSLDPVWKRYARSASVMKLLYCVVTLHLSR